MIIGISILIILVILSAFFSGSESALLSLNEFKLRHMVEKKKKNSHLIKKLKEDPHRLLTTILIANNALNLSASALATTLALQYFGEIGPAISTGILTFLILIFGEITPKAIATNHPDRFSQFAAKPLILTTKILYPFIVIFEGISKIMVKGPDKDLPRMSEEELKSIINIGEEVGSIDEEEKEMITSIFELDEITVEQVMTPRNMMFSLDKDRTLKQALPEIIEHMYSRVPLYDGDYDHIIGMLYTKDLINELEKPIDVKLEKFAKEVTFVPESMKLRQLLNKFKEEKNHIAIIIDEHGGVSGLVTIEDVLEEIVGEIYDETDVEHVMIKQINDNSARVDGTAEFEEVKKELDLKIKMNGDEDFETISGYILEKIGRIPEEKEEIDFGSFDILIEKVEGQRIKQIKIIKKH